MKGDNRSVDNGAYRASLKGASDVIGSIAHEVIRDSAANVGFP